MSFGPSVIIVEFITLRFALAEIKKKWIIHHEKIMFAQKLKTFIPLQKGICMLELYLPEVIPLSFLAIQVKVPISLLPTFSMYRSPESTEKREGKLALFAVSISAPLCCHVIWGTG